MGWSRAYKAIIPAVKMAPLQSLGYSSVVIYCTESYKKGTNPHNPNSVKVPLSVAASAGFYSALSETAFSIYHLKKMFDRWNLTHQDHSLNRSTFSRVFLITLMKNSIANPATVLGVYSVKLQIDRMLADEKSPSSVCESSVKFSAIAGFSGALLANFGFAPFVTLQTRVLENPNQTIKSHAKFLWSQSASTLFAGVGARSVAKAVQAAVGFGAVPILSALLFGSSQRFFSSKENQGGVLKDVQNDLPTLGNSK